MNLLILEKNEEISINNYRLKTRKSTHIIEILKSKVGDCLKSGIHDEKFGIFTVTNIITKFCIVEGTFTPDFQLQHSSDFGQVTILSSIQRPQTIKKILQLSSCVGIGRIIFFISEKSEKSYLNSPIWKKENLEYEFILGLEQGKRIHPPQLLLVKYKSEIWNLIDPSLKLILDLNGKSIKNYETELNESGAISILLGPESGWINSEIEYFTSKGFNEVSLSNSTLRSEYALSYCLAQIELLLNNS